jgi:hypothetical protein
MKTAGVPCHLSTMQKQALYLSSHRYLSTMVTNPLIVKPLDAKWQFVSKSSYRRRPLTPHDTEINEKTYLKNCIQNKHNNKDYINISLLRLTCIKRARFTYLLKTQVSKGPPRNAFAFMSSYQVSSITSWWGPTPYWFGC